MHEVKPWSSKYPPLSTSLTEPSDVDAYIVATQSLKRGSAHAWEIRKWGSDERLILPSVNKSSNVSTQERGSLSAAVRVVQTVAPFSKVRIFCRLENAVSGLNGESTLTRNRDIVDEYRAIAASKNLEVEAVFCGKEDFERTKVLDALLELARVCLKTSRGSNT